MKKVVKLTERDLSNIVKRVIKEDMFENDLYSDIMEVIRNSNASHEEIVSVLEYITEELLDKYLNEHDYMTRDDVNDQISGATVYVEASLSA